MVNIRTIPRVAKCFRIKKPDTSAGLMLLSSVLQPDAIKITGNFFYALGVLYAGLLLTDLLTLTNTVNIRKISRVTKSILKTRLFLLDIRQSIHTYILFRYNLSSREIVHAREIRDIFHYLGSDNATLIFLPHHDSMRVRIAYSRD